MPRVVAIVQARMTSTRLPGKVLKQVMSKPLLAYQIYRLQACHRLDDIVIATTDRATDDPIISFCEAKGLPSFRGSENDVLSRFYGAAKENKIDVAVRLTADCPLADPQVIDHGVSLFLARKGKIDYLSNTMKRTYPRGMDYEVFTMAALEEAHRHGLLPDEREHVTPYIYRYPERFRMEQVLNPVDLSRYRLTVDTPEDFWLIDKILNALHPQNPLFTLDDIVELFKQYPEWELINAHIEQKKIFLER